MTRRLGMGALLSLLLVQCGMALGEPSAGPIYRMRPLTTRETTFHSGALQNQPPAYLLWAAMDSIGKDTSKSYAHHMPKRSERAVPINLSVRSLSLLDVDLARRHPFEVPLRRVLMYWGCDETAGAKQPRAFLVQRDDDARLSTRLAPRPLERGRPQGLREIPVGERLVARVDIQFPAELRMRGQHELQHGGEVSRFEVEDRGEFLEPLDITRVWISDEGSVRIQWKRHPAASAYFVNTFVQHRHSQDAVIWTSSRVPEAGWILAQSHPGAEHLSGLRHAGVLMGPQVDQCTVPAEVVRHAGEAMVIQVHAYAEEIEAHMHAGARPAVSRVRIAPRATSSVFIRDTGRSAITMR
jgi:hypothetical protein